MFDYLVRQHCDRVSFLCVPSKSAPDQGRIWASSSPRTVTNFQFANPEDPTKSSSPLPMAH